LFERSASLTNGLTLARFSADSTRIEPGCVDLAIRSIITVPIEIPSLIPCLDAPCPEGKTCQSNYVCR
jgi:hypothetical protein